MHERHDSLPNLFLEHVMCARICQLRLLVALSEFRLLQNDVRYDRNTQGIQPSRPQELPKPNSVRKRIAQAIQQTCVRRVRLEAFR